MEDFAEPAGLHSSVVSRSWAETTFLDKVLVQIQRVGDELLRGGEGSGGNCLSPTFLVNAAEAGVVEDHSKGGLYAVFLLG